MANKTLFSNQSPGKSVPATNTVNPAGGRAYAFSPEHALAQLAATGTFNGTFYESGEAQLKAIKEAADACSPEFIAQTALWSREKGYMKDMPAALLVMLSKANPALLDRVFDRVLDNGKMLRNFVQMTRSGAFGRKSLGSGPKRLIQRWLSGRSAPALLKASVGNDPSLKDVIKLTHPKPADEERKALYAYFLGKEHDATKLPEFIQHFEAFKKGDRSKGVPKVDFRLLTSLPLTEEDWRAIAREGGWHMVRMNLNTFARHKVFEDREIRKEVAAKLKDADAIRKSKVFPYQLLMAFLNTEEVPTEIRDALQDAVEVATENVPSFGCKVGVIVDVSGSMGSAVTGNRPGATSKARCIDVAALFGSTILRRNPGSIVIPVDDQVYSNKALNGRDSIMTNAQKLAAFGGGGTALGAGVQYFANLPKADVPDLIVMVSDNMSWVDVGNNGRTGYGGTLTMQQFRCLQGKNPKAKLVCLDIQPYTSTQAADESRTVMNIGGFSDATFEVIAKFMRGDTGPDADVWVNEIKSISLAPQTAGEADEEIPVEG